MTYSALWLYEANNLNHSKVSLTIGIVSYKRTLFFQFLYILPEDEDISIISEPNVGCLGDIIGCLSVFGEVCP